MIWKEIKTWATSCGYSVDRTKAKDSENSYNYVWELDCCSGVASSTFDLARDIYNHMTKNQHAEYQIIYQKNKTYDHIHTNQTY